MNQIITAVDVDDTVIDLVTAWMSIYNKNHNDNLTKEDLVEWDVRKFVKDEAKVVVYNYLDHPSLYNMVKPIPGALEGVNELRNLGHKVIFVTHSTAGASGRKFECLQRFGFISENASYGTDYIETKCKEYIAADFLIDDKPENVSDFVKNSKYKRDSILFDAAHNRHFDWLRANNWVEVIEKIKQL